MGFNFGEESALPILLTNKIISFIIIKDRAVMRSNEEKILAASEPVSWVPSLCFLKTLFL